MISVETTSTFDEWLTGLKDAKSQSRILDRLRDGNLGAVRALGAGLSELKFIFGPAYRVYFTKRGQTIVILLCGGSKATQSKDIAHATEILEALQQSWKNEKERRPK